MQYLRFNLCKNDPENLFRAGRLNYLIKYIFANIVFFVLPLLVSNIVFRIGSLFAFLESNLMINKVIKGIKISVKHEF